MSGPRDTSDISDGSSVSGACPGIDAYDSLAFLYDGTLEGLLTAVFKTYELHQKPDDIVAESRYMPRLGQLDLRIETQPDYADRVAKGLVRSSGKRAFLAVLRASTCDDYDMGMIVYRFIRYAMSRSEKSRSHPILSEQAQPDVADLLRLETHVVNECEKMRQFIRFRQLENGVWFARCNPNASVVPLVMGHFSSRLNDQPFLIYDENHRIAGVYNGTSWELVRGEISDTLLESPNEETMQRAWKHFYDAVTIEARYNPELRRQFLPRRLWKNLPELNGIV